MTELQAGIGRCQEASPLSGTRYIPCNAPAERMVFSPRDRTEYRMCGACAHHNVRNRGMKDAGPYVGPAPVSLRPVAEAGDTEVLKEAFGVLEEAAKSVGIPEGRIFGGDLSTEDLSAYEADARASTEAEAGNILAQISNTVTELLDARALVIERETALKAATDRVRVLEEITLPELMREAKQEKLRDSLGRDIELTETLRASIPPANLPDAIRWLVDHQQAGIIKREIKLLFDREHGSDAERLLKLIRPEGFAPEDKQSVHPQTLAAVIRELLQEGVEVPLQLLGAYRQAKVKVKEPGKK